MLAESLNAMLKAYEVHTAVYRNHHGRMAIVVAVKGGKVFYLHLNPDAKITLENRTPQEFLSEFAVEYYHYPVLRAVRKYAEYVRKDNFAITDEARKVINAILVRK